MAIALATTKPGTSAVQATQQTGVSANASDLATAIALVNDLKNALINAQVIV